MLGTQFIVRYNWGLPKDEYTSQVTNQYDHLRLPIYLEAAVLVEHLEVVSNWKLKANGISDFPSTPDHE